MAEVCSRHDASNGRTNRINETKPGGRMEKREWGYNEPRVETGILSFPLCVHTRGKLD